MKGSQNFVGLSRSKGMTLDILIRDYNPPKEAASSRKSLAGVNIMLVFACIF
jgi:hypothetical protein